MEKIIEKIDKYLKESVYRDDYYSDAVEREDLREYFRKAKKAWERNNYTDEAKRAVASFIDKVVKDLDL